MTNSYPSDWPCICGHRKYQHGESVFNPSFTDCCLVPSDTKGQQYEYLPFLDACAAFKPMDNLTYIEHIARDKENVIK